ncbi:hypothetical protein IKR55_01415 [bacterium]|nr:hypothetical protein [bacterium]
MKIFYLKKDEILEQVGLEELEKYSDGKSYSLEERYIEHLCWIYLVNKVGLSYLGIVDTSIIYEDKKPVLKSGEYNFSVSHCENIVVVGFSRNNIGVDTERMRERNFERLAKRYDISPTKEEFYKFWTKYEAVIKLGSTPKQVISKIIENDYMLTCVLDSDKETDFEIIKI